MRTLLAVAAILVETQASGLTQAPESTGKEPVIPGALEEESSIGWSLSASVSGYIVPDDQDYLSPVFTADRGRLHLEGRYNYESLETASLWLGCNFSIGEKWVLDFTPMVGGVFGDTQGIAPGWRLALGRGPFEFSGEAEFVFDSDNSDDDFFYAWSELTWSVTDSFWVGLALQRTRAYETELDIQRGFLLGFSIKDVEFTTYVFNWGWTDPTLVFSVGVSF